MAKVVFYFTGTGDNGESPANHHEANINYGPDVIRIYFRSCEEDSIGNGGIFPDLNIVATNIRNSFTGNQLHLARLADNFGYGLCRIETPQSLLNENSVVDIDKIALEGFSRGAVSTFAVAKKLDDLNIPLHIIANQPVPGESSDTSQLVSRYSDLSSCRNIHSALTMLGGYNLEHGFVVNNFFGQMVARFSPDTQASTILLPFQSHGGWAGHLPFVYAHISNELATQGFARRKNYRQFIKDWYRDHPNNAFTPAEFSQAIFNVHRSEITKDPIYLEKMDEDARKYLMVTKVPVPERLTSEQASAVCSIATINFSEARCRILFNIALQNDKRAESFLKIVNKVTEVTQYLVCRLDNATQTPSEKSQLIQQKVLAYKAAVFLASAIYLTIDNPTPKNKEKFINRIKKAEHDFRADALGKERGILKSVFKVLFNFITHITGVGLIVNIINKARTGNWLLFKYNHSENIVRNTRNQLLNEIEATLPTIGK